MVIAHRHIQGDILQMEHSCKDGLGEQDCKEYTVL